MFGWRRLLISAISFMNSRRASSVSRWHSSRLTAMRERRHDASYTSPNAPAPIRWPSEISARSNSHVGRTLPSACPSIGSCDGRSGTYWTWWQVDFDNGVTGRWVVEAPGGHHYLVARARGGAWSLEIRPRLRHR